MKRAQELRPARRDTPLRELNISDDEVREVEAIARPVPAAGHGEHLAGGHRLPLRGGADVHRAGLRGRHDRTDKTRGLQLSRMNRPLATGDGAAVVAAV